MTDDSNVGCLQAGVVPKERWKARVPHGVRRGAPARVQKCGRRAQAALLSDMSTLAGEVEGYRWAPPQPPWV
jgi:hypothetical protein